MINKLNKSDKAYRNISEASEELGLEPHVLRFWESRFESLAPMVRGGKRRFYSTNDMELLQKIKTLLHEEGVSIKAANLLLIERSNSKSTQAKPLPSPRKTTPKSPITIAQLIERLDQIIANTKADISKITLLLN